MLFELRVLDREGDEDRVLARDLVTIGRAWTNELVLTGAPKVSGRHGQVEERDGRLWYRDLGSRNGSRILHADGQLSECSVERGLVPIAIGDTLLLGGVEDPVRVVVQEATEQGRPTHAPPSVGNYVLEELLGRGGMGEVWRARHSMLARPAAVKLIRAETLGQDEASRRAALRRFELEAQATANLQSPHTIQLFDYGRTEDRTFYYVMEYLDGLDLDRFVRRFGPLLPERVIHLMVQACHSLGEAHLKGLVHRDVKPANLHLCRLGREVDFVKVLDFGLVKTLHHGPETDSLLTAGQVAVGTPAYISPEQVLGDGALDARSDVYALGCVAYWLLTGERVFEADSALKTMMHHASTPPTPPSQRTELPIPGGLEEVVMACLEKAPGDRPPSADGLAQHLADCTAAAAWTPQRAQRWWATHIPHSRLPGSPSSPR
jgi:serine/threonine-protein kinase